MKKHETIFYEVDIQNDFMWENGKLSVSKAPSIIPNILALHAHAQNVDDNVIIAGSLDWHFGTEEYKDSETELAKWGGLFPEHCMENTKGAERIDGLTNDVLLFKKQSYDIFTNSKFVRWLNDVKMSGTKSAVIYGVATDYCVQAAVLGIQKIGIQCYVVEDAIMGVAADTTENAIEKMRKAGAKFISTSAIITAQVYNEHK